uniref:Ig-like domain-containing protein n=1 Tax=Taeniopygia guttata TaxID=59729 RepID=H1A280_TAEGU
MLRAGPLPFLLSSWAFHLFPLPVQLQRAGMEQFWCLLASRQTSPASGVLRTMWGSPIGGTSPRSRVVSISLEPSSSQLGPSCLLCSVVVFYPAQIQVRWFQGQQELSVVATDLVPNGDWTHQLLVLLETPTRAGLTCSCQVEHVSLEHPLSTARPPQHWGQAGRHWGNWVLLVVTEYLR